MKKAFSPTLLLLLLVAGCAIQVPDVKVNLERPPLQRKAVGTFQVPSTGVSDVLVGTLAEDGLPAVRKARLRQKQRRADLDTLEARGVVGETRTGTVVLLHPEQLRSALARRRASKLVEAENRDREVVKSWLRTVLAVSFADLKLSLDADLARYYRELAPLGAWIETGKDTWVRKEK